MGVTTGPGVAAGQGGVSSSLLLMLSYGRDVACGVLNGGFRVAVGKPALLSMLIVLSTSYREPEELGKRLPSVCLISSADFPLAPFALCPFP